MFRLCLFVLVTLGISAQAPPYVVRTVAGRFDSGEGLPADRARIIQPGPMAIDRNGTLFFVELENGRLRAVGRDGLIRTIASVFLSALGLGLDGQLYGAGGGYIYRINERTGAEVIGGTGQTTAGSTGDGGPVTRATVTDVTGIAADASGVIYFVERSAHKVRRITKDGVVQMYAGSGNVGDGGNGGPATNARLNRPTALTVDARGNLFIMDTFNSTIRRVTPEGIISIYAGGRIGIPQSNVSRLEFRFGGCDRMTTDAAGNLYFSDWYWGLIYKLNISDDKVTIVAGNGAYGTALPENLPALQAPLNLPDGLAVDSNGDIFYGEPFFDSILRITGGSIRRFAGRLPLTLDRPALQSDLKFPSSPVRDANGNLYVSEPTNNRVLQISRTGTVGVLAGTGRAGYSGDGGSARAAQLDLPRGLAVDARGNVFIADMDNLRIRRVTPEGIISTFAGDGKFGYTGDGGPATQASFRSIDFLAVDASGNLLITDTTSSVVRRIGTDGRITTIAGNGNVGSGGDGGQATAASLFLPFAVAADAAGNIYISDDGNLRLRRVSAAGVISTIAGTGRLGTPADGPATAQSLTPTSGLGVDRAGNVYWTGLFPTVHRIAPDGTMVKIAGTGKVLANNGSLNDGNAALTADLDLARSLYVNADGDVLIAEYSHILRNLVLNTASQVSIVAGATQTIAAGETSGAMTIRVMGRAEAPVAGARVSFAVASGNGTLNRTLVTTDAAGLATAAVTAGLEAGRVVVTATVAGLPAASFTVNVTAPVGPVGPRPTGEGIIGAGNSLTPVKEFSVGMMVTIGGAFQLAGAGRQIAGGDLVEGAVPRRFLGHCVLVGGQRAPIIHVFPQQITIQIPDVSPGVQPLVVVQDCDGPTELRSTPINITIRAGASPEFFYFVRRAEGPSPVAAVDSNTGAYIAAPGTIAGATFNYAQPSQVVLVFGTGFGPTNPSFAAGVIPTEAGPAAGAVAVTLGGRALSSGDIVYAGVSGSMAGLHQMNIRIPADMPDGDHALVLTIGGASSPAGLLSVRRP